MIVFLRSQAHFENPQRCNLPRAWQQPWKHPRLLHGFSGSGRQEVKPGKLMTMGLKFSLG